MAPCIRHVILDRDGVLNAERRNGGYVRNWSQWEWIPGVLQALVRLSHSGVRISVVTNQSGIARGIVARDEVDSLHARMCEEIHAAGGTMERVLVCPHAAEDHCTCRKPAPGLILRAIRASGVPLGATVAVGDDLRDLQAAWAAGIPAVLVRTGKGRATEGSIPRGRVRIFDDLTVFVAAALSDAVLQTEGFP